MPNGIRDVSREISDLLQGRVDIFADISLDIDPLRERVTTELLESLSPEVQEQQALRLAREQQAETELAAAIPAASQETAKILADLSRGAPSAAPFASVAESIAANRAQQIAGILETRSQQRAEQRQERSLRTQTTAALAGLLGDVARTEQVRTRTEIEEVQAPIQTVALLADAKERGVKADKALDIIQSQIDQRISATGKNIVDLELTREKIKEKRFENKFNDRFGEYVNLLKIDEAEADKFRAQALSEKAQLEEDLLRIYGAGEKVNDALKDQYAVESAAIKLGFLKEFGAETARAKIEGLRTGGDSISEQIARIRALRSGETVTPGIAAPETRDIAREALEGLTQRREELIVPLRDEDIQSRSEQVDIVLSQVTDEKRRQQALVLKAAQSLEGRIKKEVLNNDEWTSFISAINTAPLSDENQRFIIDVLKTAAVENKIVDQGATLEEIAIALGVINAD